MKIILTSSILSLSLLAGNAFADQLNTNFCPSLNGPGDTAPSTLNDCVTGATGWYNNSVAWFGSAVMQTKASRTCTIRNLTRSKLYIQVQYPVMSPLGRCGEMNVIPVEISGNSSQVITIPGCTGTKYPMPLIYHNISLTRMTSNGQLWRPKNVFTPNPLESKGVLVNCH